MEQPKEKILSVAEYIEFLNSGLEEYSAKISGEVGKVETPSSGHVYFTLRDETDKSTLNCIIWASRYRLYGIELKEGMKVIATGRPNVYAPTGRLSFIADVIELAGEGALKKEYERLKKKLAEEGLFALEKKRSLPNCPQKIGLITSKTGSVVWDFRYNLGKFGFKIKMIDSRVEGQEAVEDLLSAIKTFKKKDIEVLAIIRGGGAKETLEVFNNELLVREVAAFPVPVIVAIGHHKDEPLIDFAADVSVSTPTAVATEISKSWNELVLFLERQEKEIFARYSKIFAGCKEIENRLMISLSSFKNAIINVRIGLSGSLNIVFSGFGDLLSRAKQNLDYAEKIVAVSDPERQLELGYCIAFLNGKVVRKTGDVKAGDNVDLKVSDGTVSSKVTGTSKN